MTCACGHPEAKHWTQARSCGVSGCGCSQFDADLSSIPQPPIIRPPSDYTILQMGDSYELSKWVNEKLTEGYQPLGGVAVITYKEKGERRILFYQAMIK
jgi:hypothetical protein